MTIATAASVTVPRDAVNGTVLLTTGNAGTPGSASLSCTGDPETITIQLGSQVPIGQERLYPIGSTGVSYRRIYNGTATTGPRTASSSQFSGGVGFDGTTYGLQFIKTGPIAPGTIIPSGEVWSWGFGTLTPIQVSLGNTIQIIPQTCLVTTTDVAVPMAKITTSSLARVGATSTGTAFNIGVNCAGTAAKVYMTLTDQQTPGNQTSTLPLTTMSTAAGVGIQVLYQNNPMSFGPPSSDAGNPNQFSVFTSTGAANAGVTNIGLAARYVRTGTVTPGTANGAASFTMSYQ